MSNTPNIRFKGFADDWEQRKFGDVTEIKSASRVHKEEWTASGVPFFRSSDVMAAINGTENEKAYISEELYKKLSSVSGKIEKGDVLVTGGGSVGNPYIVPNNEPLYTKDADLLWVKHSDELEPFFVYEYFYSPSFRSYLGSISHVGTIAHYTITQLSNTPISLPSVAEQKKIGRYFRTLDHLINLHQRKCDEVRQLKKFMLQKMFPKSGELIPEIRFAGFTDAWEQRKLGDIVERIARKNRDLVSTLPLTISAQYGMIDQNEFFDKRVASKDVSGYYLIHRGEFAYNKSTSSDAPWGAIERLDRYENGVLSTLYIVFAIKDEEKVDSDYLVSYYETDLWHKGVREIAAEGARNHGLLNIAPADFFETSLMIPQNIEEQEKIGRYFANLDNLITLHQRKCDELKEVKRFMLQNMFV